MTAERIFQLIKSFAGPTLILRVGVVGGNFAVMLGLAWGLGLAAFGDLMVLWGIAMVAGTVLSVGAPLLILRVMGDGTGLRPDGLLRQGVIYPGGLALAALCVLPVLVPGVVWWAVIPTGLAVNALSCLASMMRALGSVQFSMALRDGVPQLALGAAACIAPEGPAAILMTAAALMFGMAGLALFWSLEHPRIGAYLRAAGDRGAVNIGLWANAVLGTVAAQIDIILGGSLMRPEQIGLYALVRRLANLVALPVSVATWVSAGPVAAAFGTGDRAALRLASAQGSRIALLPGVALFVGGLLVLSVWPALRGAEVLVVILLVGAFIQVVLASGMTIATLCGLERYALSARLVSIAVYLGCALIAGQTATGNALAYVAGIIAGGGLLWWLVWRRLGIDTSALVLWPGPRRQAWNLP